MIRLFATLVAVCCLCGPCGPVRGDVVTTTTWDFTDGQNLTSGSSSLITIGLAWSDGAWQSLVPGANFGMAAFVNGGTQSPAALVTIDSEHTGDSPYLIGLFAGVGIIGGQLDADRWLLRPSPGDFRSVFNVPDSISGLTFTHLAITAPKPADVNFDGVVNVFDVNLVSDNWGELGPVGDANADGLVNIFDVNLIASHWSSGTAVDEPSAFALACVGLVVLRLASVVRRPNLARPQGGAAVT